MTFQTCDELWAWVESFITKGQRIDDRAELRAAQFRELCQELGSPQQQFLSVHVAGSKGKGQTASYIAHGLAAQGLRVGLYSSPHIHSYSERIQVIQPLSPPKPSKELGQGRNELGTSIDLMGINFRALSDFPYPEQELVETGGDLRESGPQNGRDWQLESVDITATLLEQGSLLRQDLAGFQWFCDWDAVRQSLKGSAASNAWLSPNFFAVLTLLAYRSFAALNCDWAVLETGIGGRLCPTNAVLSELSVLTPIELEHTEVLGERLELIAAEKAAIMKFGRPCVAAQQHPEVEAVLQARSQQSQSPLYLLEHCLQSVAEVPIPLESAGPKGSHHPLLQAFLQPKQLQFELVLEAEPQPQPKIGIKKKHRISCLELRSYSSTQVDNLGLALLALQVLGMAALRPAEQAQVGYGLQRSRVRGRFDAYWLETQQCLVLFDGAHTPMSCQRLWLDLQAYLRACGPNNGPVRRVGRKPKLSLLFAAVEGKNFGEMARILAPNFDEVLLTRAGTFKRNNLASLELAFQAALLGSGPIGSTMGKTATKLLPSIAEPELALRCLLQNGPDLLLVCGSFYLLGELLPRVSLVQNGFGPPAV